MVQKVCGPNTVKHQIAYVLPNEMKMLKDKNKVSPLSSKPKRKEGNELIHTEADYNSGRESTTQYLHFHHKTESTNWPKKPCFSISPLNLSS